MKNEEEVSIKELITKIKAEFEYLLSKWLIIVFIGLAGGAVGLLFALSKKTIYTAATTFVLENNEGGGGLGQYAGLASVVGIDIGGGGGGLFQGDNIIEFYKSRTMIQKTLLSECVFKGKRELLIDRYIAFNKVRDRWNQIPALKNIKFDVNQEKLRSKDTAKIEHFSRLQDSLINTIVLDIYRNYLTVTKPDKKLSIIQVTVSSADEFFAKTFNDQIVKNVNDFYVQTKTKKSSENVAILQQKTDSVRSVLNGAIYTAASITDATPNLNVTRQIQRVFPMQRSQFTAETNKAILSELVKNLEMSKISLRRETPLIQIIDVPIYPLDKERFGKAKGIILGGIIAGILAVTLLIGRRLLKNVMS
ncbi:GumC domain-containing protein [Pedobacter duraquae]|uniref:Subunit length determinant protein n=1 Tax=Pedobacter duraquae TaxID=425511 RepID=A0A4R6IJ05_9SPHI|nr:lipopolysaccharide biosynthesis protein [Pedobacter duraquae]TDO21961.1 hypothetical protein CLV32_3070 [Pedobacter duraquae]